MSFWELGLGWGSWFERLECIDPPKVFPVFDGEEVGEMAAFSHGGDGKERGGSFLVFLLLWILLGEGGAFGASCIVYTGSFA